MRGSFNWRSGGRTARPELLDAVIHGIGNIDVAIVIHSNAGGTIELAVACARAEPAILLAPLRNMLMNGFFILEPLSKRLNPVIV